MTPEHTQQREALAAYVVGSLEPAERRAVEQHIRACRDCADELARLTPLPGLLGRVSEQEARSDLLVPGRDLLDGVIRRLADHERTLRRQVRRWRMVAIAACIAAVVVAVVAVEPWSSEPDRVVVTAEPVTTAATATTGEVAAIAWEWGTTVELAAADLPRRDGYVLWAVAEDGRRERAGSWGQTASGNAKVRGASSIARSDLARVEVTDRDGQVILVFELTADDRASAAES
jgi:anti-sigma-K factor RskA